MTSLLFILLALVCEVLGTLAGFGSSVFFVPLAQFLYSAKVVLGLTALLHVFSNSSKLFLFRRHIDKRIALIYGIPSVLLVLLGAWLATRVNTGYESVALGTFLAVFSMFLLLFPKTTIPASNTNAIVSGSAAGFFAGFLGTGGAIRGLSMSAFKLDKNVFVATSAAIDMGVDLSRAVIYVGNDFVSSEYYILIPFLLLVSFVGSYLGKEILSRISQKNFRNFVLICILVIGITTIVKSVFTL